MKHRAFDVITGADSDSKVSVEIDVYKVYGRWSFSIDLDNDPWWQVGDLDSEEDAKEMALDILRKFANGILKEINNEN